jgi:hypothetical protein
LAFGLVGGRFEFVIALIFMVMDREYEQACGGGFVVWQKTREINSRIPSRAGVTC